MRPWDLLRLAWGALSAHALRTRMTIAAMAIGIGSVLLLTALGQGAQQWIVNQFAALGSNILVVMPGRTETRGGPPMAPSTTRDITLDDLVAVERRLPGARRVVPIVVGEATVTFEGRGRTATIVGSTRSFLDIRQVRVEMGQSPPELEVHRSMRVCVIGRTLRRELFPGENPLGAKLRIGDYPYRVVGVVAEEGQRMGVDLNEMVLIPVAGAMQMFNQSGLFRMIVEVTSPEALERTEERLNDLLAERHDDEEDFTIMTPGAIADSLGNIIGILTAGLVGIAAVSLAVAGIGVMNVMVVSVTERTTEIGLMKAVGASNGQVLAVFLAEAVMLALVGGALGIAGGMGMAALGRALYPTVPFAVPLWAIYLAVGTAFAVGLVFGSLPALRAARMEPLESLRK